MTADDIHILIQVQHLPEQSPSDNQYAFAYQITISNRGDQSVQLISRHWIIVDANEKHQEVKGLGVVGEQPHIAPGSSYQYTSGVVLQTPTGTMEGSYHINCTDGSEWDVPIPAFVLATPGTLH